MRGGAELTRMYSQRVLESHPAGCAGDDLLSNYSGNESMGRMQKELHTGIDLAVALIKQDTLPALLNTATRQLESAFGLSKCWALELDLSGRTLHCSKCSRILLIRTLPNSLLTHGI